MDDDDIGYVRRNKVVHYGSLANNEQLGNSQKNAAGSNVSVSTEFMPLSKDENPLLEDRTEILEEFERRKREYIKYFVDNVDVPVASNCDKEISHLIYQK